MLDKDFFFFFLLLVITDYNWFVTVVIPEPQKRSQYVTFCHSDIYMKLHFTEEKKRNPTCNLQKETRFPNMKRHGSVHEKMGVFGHGQPQFPLFLLTYYTGISTLLESTGKKRFHSDFLPLHSFCYLIGKIEMLAHLGVSLLDRSNNFFHLFSIW